LEASLREPVRAHFAGLGGRVRHEVPLHGRIADLVVARDDDLVAVELKLQDWQEAFAQAMHYQLAAHRSYIAMPLDHAIVPLRSRTRLERQGVGLLGVHPLGEVRTLLEARESARRLPFLTEHTLDLWFRAPAEHRALTLAPAEGSGANVVEQPQPHPLVEGVQ
jgi:hypothetical protein